ncbi:MAG: GAF domain-containing protein [Terriglobales bacterium]
MLNRMPGFPQPDDPSAALNVSGEVADGRQFSSGGGDGPSARRALEEPELEAALQLLVERAQYITGATGTALALPQGSEMVCRASAGSCAPSIGARLQVRSGLTGESIARRQLLRCDNAEADPRVNLEACRALGIASIVVLPLLRRNGEVRGLLELFSDHPYAFEERDLIALERMADLTLTALDLAEQRHDAVAPAPPEKQSEASRVRTPVSSSANVVAAASTLRAPREIPAPMPSPSPVAERERVSLHSDFSQLHAEQPPAELIMPPALEMNPAAESAPSTLLPDSTGRVQKCAGCGFPVSEGRTLCLDCERKQDAKIEEAQNLNQPVNQEPGGLAALPDEVLPPFLANAAPVKESWLSDHVNLLAIVVLILAVLVVIVLVR